MSDLMAGKRGLIMGLANDRSLAWGIAKALHAQGAEMAFSYQGEGLERGVRPLALGGVRSSFLCGCRVCGAGPPPPPPLGGKRGGEKCFFFPPPGGGARHVRN